MSTDEPEKLPPEEWTVEALLGVLRRQAIGLRTIRDHLTKDPSAKPADDSSEMMEAILNLKAISAYADDITRVLHHEVPIDRGEE